MKMWLFFTGKDSDRQHEDSLLRGVLCARTLGCRRKPNLVRHELLGPDIFATSQSSRPIDSFPPAEQNDCSWRPATTASPRWHCAQRGYRCMLGPALRNLLEQTPSSRSPPHRARGNLRDLVWQSAKLSCPAKSDIFMLKHKLETSTRFNTDHVHQNG